MISHSGKFIHIHVPKSAGNSITQALSDHWDCPARQHLIAYEVRDLIGPERFNSYFKFSFVRNPWDKVVSSYHFQKKKNRVRGLTFRQWVLSRQLVTGSAEKYTTSQFYWLSDEEEPLMDFVGRYENLEEDWKKVLDHVRLKWIELPHENKSAHSHYRTYYNNMTKEFVRSRYQKDIDYFNYEF